MTLVLEARKVYGEVKFYPASDAAKALADALGTKTLDLRKARSVAAAFGADVLVLNESLAPRNLYAA